MPVVDADDMHRAAAIARNRSLEATHRLATGEGVTVAVIDTGVSPHDNLPALTGGGDFIDGDTIDGGLFDCDAHGTIVAGIIAAGTGDATALTADGDPGMVPTGVAPRAHLVTIRQTSAAVTTPAGRAGSLATLAEAIGRALDQGAQVINISVVSCVKPSVAARVDTAPIEEVLARAEAQGTVVVSASGNKGGACEADSVVYPAVGPTVLSVTAVDAAGEPADFAVAATDPAVAGPGWVPVGLSTAGDGLILGTGDPDTPTPLVGTSFAAPWVAGVAALLKQRFPLDSPQQIRDRIVASTDPVTGAVDPYRAITFLRDDDDHPRPARTVQVAAPGPPDTTGRRRASVTAATLAATVTAAVLAFLLRPGLRPTIPPVARLRRRRRGTRAGA
ncbi:S8 family serine peptidase [Corynebacterium mendelii]|uniref:S8 family serine peptidase n=1 Tax=Corynebacterium mendelii TaxID=2765362 RepID=A0A939IVA4_9CORY|nr:S8 family serine peptidase [Corynebacterium mendelii]